MKRVVFIMVGYYKIKKIGEGTYAVIYKAKVIEESENKIVKNDPEGERRFVAIKKIKKTEYSFGQEISAVREIKVLKAIQSEYVLRLEDVFIHKDYIHLVLEYVEWNLEDVFKNKDILIMPGNIKAWMFMLLSGLYECHKRFFVHRDIKPNNLLLNSKGILKLADFGLSRRIASRMTPQAVTRWYRAPEVLLAAKTYSTESDMWSVGCVFAEMFLRVPLFAGDTDIKQLDLIFSLLGTPSEKEWPEMKNLPGYFSFRHVIGTPLKNFFTAVSDDAIDLLKRMLTYNPQKRITCIEALQHEYFTSEPLATSLDSLLVPKSSKDN